MTKGTMARVTRALGRAADAVNDAMGVVAEAMREGDADSGIIKIKDAAKAAGLHPNTIRRLASEGKLKAVKGSGDRVIGITQDSFRDFLR